MKSIEKLEEDGQAWLCVFFLVFEGLGSRTVKLRHTYNGTNDSERKVEDKKRCICLALQFHETLSVSIFKT
jgi:hypothetical protein